MELLKNKLCQTNLIFSNSPRVRDVVVRKETVGAMDPDFSQALYTGLYDSVISRLGNHNVEEINKEDARLF